MSRHGLLAGMIAGVLLWVDPVGADELESLGSLIALSEPLMVVATETDARGTPVPVRVEVGFPSAYLSVARLGRETPPPMPYMVGTALPLLLFAEAPSGGSVFRLDAGTMVAAIPVSLVAGSDRNDIARLGAADRISSIESLVCADLGLAATWRAGVGVRFYQAVRRRRTTVSVDFEYAPLLERSPEGTVRVDQFLYTYVQPHVGYWGSLQPVVFGRRETVDSDAIAWTEDVYVATVQSHGGSIGLRLGTYGRTRVAVEMLGTNAHILGRALLQAGNDPNEIVASGVISQREVDVLLKEERLPTAVTEVAVDRVFGVDILYGFSRMPDLPTEWYPMNIVVGAWGVRGSFRARFAAIGLHVEMGVEPGIVPLIGREVSRRADNVFFGFAMLVAL